MLIHRFFIWNFLLAVAVNLYFTDGALSLLNKKITSRFKTLAAKSNVLSRKNSEQVKRSATPLLHVTSPTGTSTLPPNTYPAPGSFGTPPPNTYPAPGSFGTPPPNTYPAPGSFGTPPPNTYPAPGSLGTPPPNTYPAPGSFGTPPPNTYPAPGSFGTPPPNTYPISGPTMGFPADPFSFLTVTTYESGGCEGSIQYAVIYRAGVCAVYENTDNRWVTWMITSDGQTVTATPTLFVDPYCSVTALNQTISEHWNRGCQDHGSDTDIAVSNFQPQLKLNAVVFDVYGTQDGCSLGSGSPFATVYLVYHGFGQCHADGDNSESLTCSAGMLYNYTYSSPNCWNQATSMPIQFGPPFCSFNDEIVAGFHRTRCESKDYGIGVQGTLSVAGCNNGSSTYNSLFAPLSTCFPNSIADGTWQKWIASNGPDGYEISNLYGFMSELLCETCLNAWDAPFANRFNNIPGSMFPYHTNMHCSDYRPNAYYAFQITPQTVMETTEPLKQKYDGPTLPSSTSNCPNPLSNSDGWCDSLNNNADCHYDGGDCCPETCGNGYGTNYTCGHFGYNCIDPAVNRASLPPLYGQIGWFDESNCVGWPEALVFAAIGHCFVDPANIWLLNVPSAHYTDAWKVNGDGTASDCTNSFVPMLTSPASNVPADQCFGGVDGLFYAIGKQHKNIIVSLPPITCPMNAYVVDGNTCVCMRGFVMSAGACIRCPLGYSTIYDGSDNCVLTDDIAIIAEKRCFGLPSTRNILYPGSINIKFMNHTEEKMIVFSGVSNSFYDKVHTIEARFVVSHMKHPIGAQSFDRVLTKEDNHDGEIYLLQVPKDRPHSFSMSFPSCCEYNLKPFEYISKLRLKFFSVETQEMLLANNLVGCKDLFLDHFSSVGSPHCSMPPIPPPYDHDWTMIPTPPPYSYY